MLGKSGGKRKRILGGTNKRQCVLGVVWAWFVFSSACCLSYRNGIGSTSSNLFICWTVHPFHRTVGRTGWIQLHLLLIIQSTGDNNKTNRARLTTGIQGSPELLFFQPCTGLYFEKALLGSHLFFAVSNINFLHGSAP